jgi:16S rRNA (guanine527-N7)-methyltransferase
LISEANGLGIALTARQAALLDGYVQKVAEANLRLNLTAITEPREVEVKHLLDCLVLCGLPELRGAVADVGTGAGFPGVVVKISRPELRLTLIDATAKKLRFVEAACAELDISVQTSHGRAEELARGRLREAFDTVVARAVAPLDRLAEYCLPLVKVGGFLLAMKGPDAVAELSGSAAAIAQLGGKAGEGARFVLPGGAERMVVKIKKISQTPPKYPRNGKNIAKCPLKNR